MAGVLRRAAAHAGSRCAHGAARPVSVAGSALRAQGLLTRQATLGAQVEVVGPATLGGATRNMSFFSRLQGMMQRKADEKQEVQRIKSEKDLIDFLAKAERFDFEVFAQYTKNTLKESGMDGTGWRSMIPGLRSASNMEAVESMINICSLMTTEERTMRKKLDERAIERIASAAATTPANIEEFVNLVQSFSTIHRWTRRRVKEGIPPAESFADIQVGMQLDRRGMPARPPAWMIARMKQHQAAEAKAKAAARTKARGHF